MMNKSIVIFAFFLLVITCQARVIYVDPDGVGDFPTIQDINNDVNNGDDVATSDVWTSNGPYGGYITDIAISPNYISDQTVFAASSKGVYKSIDGGGSWTQVDTSYIYALAISPDYTNDQTIFAGTQKSTDGGFTWNETGVPIKASTMAISPNYENDKTIFVGSSWKKGVAKSSDGGVTWTLINNDFEELDNYSLAISTNFANDQTIFAGQGRYIYKSTDGGNSWLKVLYGGNYPEAIVISPNYAVDKTVFVGFWDEDIHKSTNGGVSWTSIGQPESTAFTISPDFATDQTIFAGNLEGGVSKSTDGGTSWSVVNNGLAICWVQSLTISPAYSIDQTIFVGLGVNGDGPGIYKSTNGADSWSEANNNLHLGRVIGSVAVSPDYANDYTLFASTTGYARNVFKSINGANSWSVIGNGVGGVLSISPDFVNDQTIFAGGIKSTDGGDSWQTSGLDLLSGCWDSAISPNYPMDQTIFLCSNGGVYKSTNAGTSWTKINNGLAVTTIVEIEISPNYSIDQTIFAGCNNNGVYISTNGGDLWTLINNGLPTTPTYTGPSVQGLIISPDYDIDQTLFVAIREHGIFKSIDSGNYWKQVYLFSTPAFPAFAISPDYVNDQTILFFTQFTPAVLKSTDGGSTWIQLSKMELPKYVYLNDVAVSNNYVNDHVIFSCTTNGVWVFDTTPIADAGPNTIAYAIDGIAEVTLDGSDSYDPDGDELTYLWSWVIDGDAYDADGVSPTIKAPTGEYLIELVVSDSIEISEVDTVVVIVMGPVELLDTLAQDVTDLCLQHGIENSLLAKLDAAIQKLDDENENNDNAAVNLLRAFINTIQAQNVKKISKEDADNLITAAQQIIDMLISE